ncbi:MAG: glutathione transferase GstA [Burkholderiaceae bacterium]|jgi:glutathione S-transferase|nr:glutathione transferase GstA [Burkholderiaceae bacterium]
MKLFYSPGACSRAVRIALHEAAMPFDGVLASTKTHKLPDGGDYYAINPKGYVPLLELDDGQRLTEVQAIVQWVADQKPESRLAPPAGTMPRYRLMEWLSFISSEVHKQFSPLFNPAYPEEAKQINRAKILQRLEWVDAQLAGKQYLMGDTFTVADAYFYVISGWTTPMKIDISSLKNLAAYRQRVSERPSVQRSVQEEEKS